MSTIHMQEGSKLKLAPLAPDIAKSLRGLGYSAGSAAADLVDNSIAAGARNVRANFEWSDAPRVVLADDGIGMTPEDLVSAMRLGSDPDAVRKPGDMGRFGLGLKTASLSQARSVAVVTRADGGAPSAARWNLDVIEAASDWNLEIGTPEQLGLSADLLIGPTGTAVIWESLDLLLGSHATIDALYDTAEVVARHLGMTFHRFIESGRTDLFVNDVAVAPWDPLAIGVAKETFIEELQPAGIKLRGCILPSPDELDATEAARLAGPNDWLEQQGVYVYREDRLIAGGGWLGIGRSTQPWRLDRKYNLARLSIDLDNTQDVAWAIDIRKSSATPPTALRPDLYQFASRLRRRAVARVRLDVAVATGSPAAGGSVPIWVAPSTGGISFKLNRRHPLVTRVRHGGGDGTALRSLLDAIERTAPLQGASLAVAPIDAVALARLRQTEIDLTRLVRTLYPNLRKAVGLSPEEAKVRLLEHLSMGEHEEFLATLIESLEKELKVDI